MTRKFDDTAAKHVRELISSTPHFVYAETFGCQQNEADSESLCGMALEMGYEKTEDVTRASLILVNTCAIREHAEKRALTAIGQFGRLKKANPELIIGVCGCMTAQSHRAEEIKQHYPYVSFTLAPGAMHKLPELVLGALQSRRRRFETEQDCTHVVEGMPVCRTEKHKAWVTVMYGCNNFCSYCIVPYVRGRERSRDAAEILAEVRELVLHGTKEITLLGQNVNSYRSGETDFSGLLSELCSIEGDYIIRFMTSHPKDVPDALIDVMAKNPGHLAPHFHLPLQSGSDRVLKAMNRRYDTARYLDVVKKLRSAVPEISITTDIIVGFPGETEQDFEATLAMMERVGFDLVYSFIYSPRRGTPAADMPEQIEQGVKTERMTRLLALQDGIALKCAKKWLDRDVRVLADGLSKTGGGIYSGRTAHNKLVHFRADDSCIGKYLTVHITRADAFALHGEIKEV